MVNTNKLNLLRVLRHEYMWQIFLKLMPIVVALFGTFNFWSLIFREAQTTTIISDFLSFILEYLLNSWTLVWQNSSQLQCSICHDAQKGSIGKDLCPTCALVQLQKLLRLEFPVQSWTVPPDRNSVYTTLKLKQMSLLDADDQSGLVIKEIRVLFQPIWLTCWI